MYNESKKYILKKFPLDRQLDMMDCGPASLKMISKFYGKYYSLQFLRDLCGNTREGVSLAGISHGAEKIGLRSLAAHCSTDDLIEKVPLPIIIHWDNSHFVVLFDVKKKETKKQLSILPILLKVMLVTIKFKMKLLFINSYQKPCLIYVLFSVKLLLKIKC